MLSYTIIIAFVQLYKDSIILETVVLPELYSALAPEGINPIKPSVDLPDHVDSLKPFTGLCACHKF